MKAKIWKVFFLFGGIVLAGVGMYVWYRLGIDSTGLMEGTFV
jgi:hypothetical protein